MGWILTSSNEDLAQAVAEGRCSSGPLFPINVINIELPPLRDGFRISPASGPFLDNSVGRRVGKSRVHAGSHAGTANIFWPGNVRELQNVIERAVLLGRQGSDD